MIRQHIRARPFNTAYVGGEPSAPLQGAFHAVWTHNLDAPFSTILRAMRQRLGVDQRSFAKMLGIQHGYICGWEAESKACGPELADRLAARIGLAGRVRELFLYRAAATLRGPAVIGPASDYPAEILDGIASVLRQGGIGPERIEKVEVIPIDPSPADKAAAQVCLRIKVADSSNWWKCTVVLEQGKEP
jgi:transcriptional regulator with XRE-family HTH domain